MAKQLVVTVKAVDQLSPVMRGSIDSILRFGRRVLDTTQRVTRALLAPLRAITSIRGMLLTFTAGVGIRRLVGSFNQATEAIDDMAKASQRLGISVEQLSSLKHAAELAGSSFEGLLDGFETLAKNAGQFAATGGGRAADAFGLLGSRVREAARAGAPLNELIAQIADGINAVGDASQRQFIVQRLFGENGSEWLTLLREGGDRLRAFNEEARRLNAIISPEQARIAEEYRDSITRIQSAWLGLRATLLETVGPTLTRILNRAAEILAAIPEMVGNLMRTIRQAFGSGPEADAAREALTDMVASWGDVLRVGIIGIGKVALSVVQSVLRLIFNDANAMTGRWLDNIIPRLLLQMSKSYNVFMRDWLAMTDRDVRIFQDRIDVVEIELAKLRGDTVRGMRAGEFEQSLGTDFPEIKAAIEDVRRSMGEAGTAAFEALDRVLGIVEALSKTALPELRNRIRDATKAGPGSEMDRFFEGWKQGWGDWLDRARDTLHQARELAGNVMDAIAGSMTSAFNDIIQGTKSLSDAFRTMLSNILRQVSELIVQLLVVRAIASAVGIFGGGGGTSPPAVGGGGFKPGTGFGPVQRFADGGALVPAFAGPRGRIVTAPEVFPMARGYGLRGERGPEAVLPLTRVGGRLGVDASGGGAVHYNAPITININGAPDTDGLAKQVKFVLQNLAELVNHDFARKPTQRGIFDSRSMRL